MTIRFSRQSRTMLLPMVVLAVLLGTVTTATPVLAATRIVLDGQFSDWSGQIRIPDPAGDAAEGGDIIAFSWANNPGDATPFWMLERTKSDRNVTYIVYFDANNNGKFNEHVDRAVVVKYNPKKKDSKVSVEVRYADDWRLISRTNNMDWGESLEEGAAKVEFTASRADLGFGIGQTIRMYAASFTAQPSKNNDGEDNSEVNTDDNRRLPPPTDRVPNSGDVQWSPIPVLGYPLMASILVGGVLLVWYYKGRRAWH